MRITCTRNHFSYSVSGIIHVIWYHSLALAYLLLCGIYPILLICDPITFPFAIPWSWFTAITSALAGKQTNKRKRETATAAATIAMEEHLRCQCGTIYLLPIIIYLRSPCSVLLDFVANICTQKPCARSWIETGKQIHGTFSWSFDFVHCIFNDDLRHSILLTENVAADDYLSRVYEGRTANRNTTHRN